MTEKHNLSEEDKDMIVNVISLVIQNIISKNQSLKGCPKKINEREREKKKKRKSSCACL